MTATSTPAHDVLAPVSRALVHAGFWHESPTSAPRAVRFDDGIFRAVTDSLMTLISSDIPRASIFDISDDLSPACTDGCAVCSDDDDTTTTTTNEGHTMPSTAIAFRARDNYGACVLPYGDGTIESLLLDGWYTPQDGEPSSLAIFAAGQEITVATWDGTDLYVSADLNPVSVAHALLWVACDADVVTPDGTRYHSTPTHNH